MTKDEFQRRFTVHMCERAGFTHFDDGTAVADYASTSVATYWADEGYRREGPEECAESDMDYWGEE